MVGDPVAVHLGHDERDAGLEPVGRRLVNRDGAAARRGDELERRLRPDREQRDVDPAGGGTSGVASSTTVPSASVDPADRGGEGGTFSASLAQDPHRHGAHGAGRSDHGDAGVTHRRAPHKHRTCRGRPAPPARPPWRTTQETRIEDVGMISMLMPASAGFEHVGGNARMALHPGANERDLGDLVVEVDGRCADLDGEPVEDRLGDHQVALRQRRRDVRRTLAETFCTIMSMFTPASASARKTRAAMPRLSEYREDRRLRFRKHRG